jgi:hypothetical protein
LQNDLAQIATYGIYLEDFWANNSAYMLSLLVFYCFLEWYPVSCKNICNSIIICIEMGRKRHQSWIFSRICRTDLIMLQKIQLLKCQVSIRLCFILWAFSNFLFAFIIVSRI